MVGGGLEPMEDGVQTEEMHQWDVPGNLYFFWLWTSSLLPVCCHNNSFCFYHHEAHCTALTRKTDSKSKKKKKGGGQNRLSPLQITFAMYFERATTTTTKSNSKVSLTSIYKFSL